jgi:hypothetical protein
MYDFVVIKKMFDEIFDEVHFFFLLIFAFTFVPLVYNFEKPNKKMKVRD